MGLNALMGRVSDEREAENLERLIEKLGPKAPKALRRRLAELRRRLQDQHDRDDEAARPGVLEIFEGDNVWLGSLFSFAAEMYLSVNPDTMKPALEKDETHWLVFRRKDGDVLTHVGFLSMNDSSKSRPGTGAILCASEFPEAIPLESDGDNTGFRAAANDIDSRWDIDRPGKLGPNDTRTRPTTLTSKIGRLCVDPAENQLVVTEDFGGEPGRPNPFWRSDWGESTFLQEIDSMSSQQAFRNGTIRIIIEAAIEFCKAGLCA